MFLKLLFSELMQLKYMAASDSLFGYRPILLSYLCLLGFQSAFMEVNFFTSMSFEDHSNLDDDIQLSLGRELQHKSWR